MKIKLILFICIICFISCKNKHNNVKNPSKRVKIDRILKRWIGDKKIVLKTQRENSFFVNGYLLNENGEQCKFKLPYIFLKPKNKYWKTSDYEPYSTQAWKICKNIKVDQKELIDTRYFQRKNNAPPLIILAALVNNFNVIKKLIKNNNDSTIRWGVKSETPPFCPQSPFMDILHLNMKEKNLRFFMDKFYSSPICKGLAFIGTPYVYAKSVENIKSAKILKNPDSTKSKFFQQAEDQHHPFILMPEYEMFFNHNVQHFINLTMFGSNFRKSLGIAFYDRFTDDGEYYFPYGFFFENILGHNYNNKSLIPFDFENEYSKFKFFKELVFQLAYLNNSLINNISRSMGNDDFYKIEKHCVLGSILGGNPHLVSDCGVKLKTFCDKNKNLCKLSTYFLIAMDKIKSAKFMIQKYPQYFDEKLLYLALVNGGNLKNVKLLYNYSNLKYIKKSGFYLSLKMGRKKILNYFINSNVRSIPKPFPNTIILDSILKNRLYSLFPKISNLYNKSKLAEYFVKYPTIQFWKIIKNDIKLSKTQIDKCLLNSSKTNNFLLVKKFMKMGGNPNYLSDFYSPIHWAVRNKNLKILEYLLKNKGDANLKAFFDGYGKKTTPVMGAIATQDIKMLELIVKYGGKIGSFEINQAKHHKLKLVNQWISKQIKFKIKIENENLRIAILNKKNGLAKKIIDNLKNIEIQLFEPTCCPSCGGLPTYYAVIYNNFEIFKYLIKKGADPFLAKRKIFHYKNEGCISSFSHAAKHNLKVLKYLIKKYPEKKLIKRGAKHSIYKGKVNDLEIFDFYISKGIKLKETAVKKYLYTGSKQFIDRIIKINNKEHFFSNEEIKKILNERANGLIEGYDPSEELFSTLVKYGADLKLKYFSVVNFKEFRDLYNLKNKSKFFKYDVEIFKMAVLKNKFKIQSFLIKNIGVNSNLINGSTSNPSLFFELYKKKKSHSLDEKLKYLISSIKYNRKPVLDFLVKNIEKINIDVLIQAANYGSPLFFNELIKKYYNGKLDKRTSSKILNSSKYIHPEIVKILGKFKGEIKYKNLNKLIDSDELYLIEEVVKLYKNKNIKRKKQLILYAYNKGKLNSYNVFLKSFGCFLSKELYNKMFDKKNPDIQNSLMLNYLLKYCSKHLPENIPEFENIDDMEISFNKIEDIMPILKTSTGKTKLIVEILKHYIQKLDYAKIITILRIIKNFNIKRSIFNGAIDWYFGSSFDYNKKLSKHIFHYKNLKLLQSFIDTFGLNYKKGKFSFLTYSIKNELNIFIYYLLKKGIRVQYFDMKIAMIHNPKILYILNKFNKNFNKKNELGNNLLFYGKQINEKTLKLLLNKGLNINQINDKGETPLYSIVNSYQYYPKLTLELYLKYGANSNLTPINKNPILHLLIETKQLNEKTLKLFLKYKTNINIEGINKKTPLIYFSKIEKYRDDYKKELIKVLELLLKYGAKINVQDAFGNTAMYYAIEEFKFEFIKILRTNGASTKIKNKKGETPEDLLKKLINNIKTEIKKIRKNLKLLENLREKSEAILKKIKDKKEKLKDLEKDLKIRKMLLKTF
jgi:ankyrin repeat protein